jgi:hypothetical protein
MENACFCLARRYHNGVPYYYFAMKPAKNVTQLDFDTLTSALGAICNHKTEKNSVLLDCTLLQTFEDVRRFLSLRVFKALELGNTGLSKFIIISSSSLVQKFSKPLIALKNASTYAFVCETTEAALELL